LGLLALSGDRVVPFGRLASVSNRALGRATLGPVGAGSAGAGAEATCGRPTTPGRWGGSGGRSSAGSACRAS